MKYLSLKSIGPALAVAAILSLSACTTPMGMQGCCNMNCCSKMHCCSGKMNCCKSMKGCCCCHGNGKVQGCPYTPKHKN